MNTIERKNTGSFYTSNSISDFVSKWAINDASATILEPSFGDGIFIESALNRFKNLNNNSPSICGVELQKEPYMRAISNYPNVETHLIDYMEFETEKRFDAVIGNPPYVSLKKLKSDDRKKAFQCMKTEKYELNPSASLWVPFIVKSVNLLNRNGKLGFVLPYELTYVRYAFPLWSFLSDNFGELSIIRLYDDFFPDVDVETVLLLADRKGDTTKHLKYRVFNDIDSLLKNSPEIDEQILIDDVIQMRKPFECKLMTSDLQELLSELERKEILQPMLGECKFKIGYVCGNKDYFHPDNSTVIDFGLDQDSLLPCLLNSRDLLQKNGVGLDAGKNITHRSLFFPKNPDENDLNYIKYGETKNVHKGYKCSIRTPWYLTPNIEIPDLIMSVFGDIPKLITNSGKYVVSNSLLSGTVNDKSNVTSLACRWYNSLTLLLVELNVHSLGGGTLVAIPGEIDKMSMLKTINGADYDGIFDQLDMCAKSEGLAAAYELGNSLVLKDLYGFTEKQIDVINYNLSKLRNWRRPDNRRG